MALPIPQIGPAIAPKKKPLTYNGVDLTSPGTPKAPQFKLDNPQSIADSVANSTNQANTANDKRYGQGLNVLTSGYNSAGGMIGEAMNNTSYSGQSQRRDIRQQLVNDQAKTQQSAVSRGIGNTTIVDSLQAGNQRVANNAMSDVNAQVQAQQNALRLQQANNFTGGANSIAGFIGGRNDMAPDLGTFAQLIQNAAANKDTGKNVGTVTNGSINDPIKLGSSAKGYTGGSISGSIGGGGAGAIGTALGGGGGGGSSAGGAGQYFGPGTGTNNLPVNLADLGYRGAVGEPSKPVAGTTPTQNCRPYNYITDSGLTPNANGMICK
jgi:hypothetical protein